jgi:inorganic pyrophosphatase
MSQEKHSRHAVLSETTTFDRNSGDLRIVIETPKGSRNKYKYEPECDCLEADERSAGRDDISL